MNTNSSEGWEGAPRTSIYHDEAGQGFGKLLSRVCWPWLIAHFLSPMAKQRGPNICVVGTVYDESSWSLGIADDR